MRRHDEGHHEERGDTATSKQHGQSDRALINKRNSRNAPEKNTHTHTHTHTQAKHRHTHSPSGSDTTVLAHNISHQIQTF